MTNSLYFPHDYNPRSDDRLKPLIRKYGMLGYGIFWAIVEDLYNNANALRTDYEGIAYELRTDTEIIKSIINDFGLFVFEGDYFGSLSVQRRLDLRSQKTLKARESAYKRWNNNANAMQTQCDRIENVCEGNAIKKRKERKEKKVNKEIIYPQISEVENYFLENGYSKESANKFFKYYNDADWKDSQGKKVLNWKQKAQAVWFKDENRGKSCKLEVLR